MSSATEDRIAALCNMRAHIERFRPELHLEVLRKHTGQQLMPGFSHGLEGVEARVAAGATVLDALAAELGQLTGEEEFDERDAQLSACGLYRYYLCRYWSLKGKTVAFVMLNPSTADARVDDPTCRRCAGFARRLGACGFDVVNLFAWRATKPDELKHAADPVGPENDAWLERAAKSSDIIIAAWGAHGSLHGRDTQVLRLLRQHGPVYCLGRTKAGHPRHPLYLPASAGLELLEERA